MKKLLFIFILLSSVFAHCQYTNLTASKINSQSIETDDYIGNDSYGDQYFIKNNVLNKTTKTEVLQYKNLSLGKITKVDIQNPLRIIVFYGNFNIVIVLDNQLNEVQKINFSENLEAITPTAIGISSQNRLWAFNSMNQQLGLYDFTKSNYQTIGLPFEKNIKNYTSDFNYFYWIDETNQFYSSDIFGKKKLLGKIPKYDLVFISDEKTVLFKESEILYYFDVEKNKALPINNIEKSNKNFSYKNQNLSIFTNEGITNYKINLP